MRPMPPPTLTSRIGQPTSTRWRAIPTAAASAPSKAANPSASQPKPAWKWSVSTTRSCRRAAASASSSRSAVMPSFVGARAGICQPFVVAGADHGVDAQADGRARRSPADPLDLADGVEVEVHACAEDDVEVALRAVRAGVRRSRPPTSRGRGRTRPRRVSRRRYRPRQAHHVPRATQDREDLRLSIGFERETEPMVEPGATGRRVHRPDVLADALEVRRRSAAYPESGPAPRHRDRR